MLAAITLSIPIWLILLIVLIISIVITYWYGNTHDEGFLDFRPLLAIFVCIIFNLIMYLSYIIIV